MTLSGNLLKIIAVISMFIDHMGFFLFPDTVIFRIAGRIAFPVFAFMISESCRYTRNRLRFFLTLFLYAVIIQTVLFISTGSSFMNIFFTLSVSALVIYSKPENYASSSELLRFILTLVFTYIVAEKFNLDYGFFGCVLPLFASFYEDNKLYRVAVFTLGLFLLSLSVGKIQYYCLLSVPLIYLYSGKRGKYNIKYFFYAFYPAHLILIYIAKGLWF